MFEVGGQVIGQPCRTGGWQINDFSREVGFAREVVGLSDQDIAKNNRLTQLMDLHGQWKLKQEVKVEALRELASAAGILLDCAEPTDWDADSGEYFVAAENMEELRLALAKAEQVIKNKED